MSFWLAAIFSELARAGKLLYKLIQALVGNDLKSPAAGGTSLAMSFWLAAIFSEL
eukprot:CAMPEP_0197633684 /NCGR_PEP_ID=MMETSP1338-20131121/9996_1 /TAXON_ID=43686 ORGANISM="Pelagodinium beii, Strain RCC1491" /NCGR_SAMPLE_ID=MMETSP1338 /ASSEMBLY_ACC=CAM_ASM_000754 /LENGTH=54 /DNA_ID=CAMNT_0043205399 /DNA_START=1 /DNA_END=161 /DNA_ORIENTATION=-